MFNPIDLQGVFDFVRPHLTSTQFEGFQLHAIGKATASVELARGWVVYWGFSDFLTDSRSFPDRVDCDYDLGRKLGADYLASVYHAESR
jgi:hypothetical protein